MKKASRILLAVLFIPLMVGIVSAASTYVGQLTQAVSGTFWQATQPVSGTFWQATQAVSNGGTFAVQAAAVLAAETTKIIGTVNVASGQTIAVTNTGTFAVQTAASVSIPTVAKVAATTTTGQLIAANATRKGIEVDCDCANTDSVAINWGASAAVYATHKQLTPCSNWSPPAGIAVQTAIQIIANTGTQNCRVIEYP